jgi:phosphatidate phosphatase APP1
MRPGEDCLRCHNGQRGTAWTLAGTIFNSPTATVDQGVQNVSITITDSKGQQVTLTSNGSGNFYTRESLTPPFTAVAELNGAKQMMTDPAIGACNSCHTDPPQNKAPGRMYAP